MIELLELVNNTIEKLKEIINEKDKKNANFRKRIQEIVDKAEVMDYYDLNNVIDDLKIFLEETDEESNH